MNLFKTFEKENKFWSIPKINKNHKRSISLLELFFDVIVVASLSGIVHNIEEILKNINDHSIDIYKMINYFIQMFFILLIWNSFTMYSSRYETKDLRHIFLTLVLMLCMCLVVVDTWASNKVEESIQKIMLAINFLGFSLTMFVLWYMYITVSQNSISIFEKKSLRWISIGKLVSALLIFLLFLLAIFINLNTEYWKILFVIFNVVGLLIWILFDFSYYSNKYFANIKQHFNDHIQERYSILFIIFIGETFLQVITESAINIKDNLESIQISILKMFAGFFLIFFMWWVFRELYNLPDISYHPKKLFLYIFSMIFMYISLAITTIGLSLLVDGYTIKNDKKISFLYIGKIALFIGTFLISIINPITIYSLQHHIKKERFIWPKWFIIFQYLSPINFFLTSWVFFIESWSGYILFIATILALFINILIIVYMRISISMNMTKNENEFDIETNKEMKSQESWIYKYIYPHLDIEWHKNNNWQVNEFSFYAKAKYLASKNTTFPNKLIKKK